METILVTGGAGYIGSVCVHQLIKQGYGVIVVDNMSKGQRHLVPEQVRLYELDLAHDDLDIVFNHHTIDAVIHFAGYKAVDESMKNAVKYSDNVKGTVNLLNVMVKHGVKRIIYSSSAAVYGDPEYTPMDENHPTRPMNYYGYTKRESEHQMEWYKQIHGIEYVSLRYFNIVGDALSYLDPDPKNVLPLILEAATGKREQFIIFGDDYETKDGTCIRDYIDVNDLVDAHIKALGVDGSHIINLGTSTGTSVKELLRLTEQCMGKDIPHSIGPRRAGDPAVVVASNTKAFDVLRWKPHTPLKESIQKMVTVYLKSE